MKIKKSACVCITQWSSMPTWDQHEPPRAIKNIFVFDSIFDSCKQYLNGFYALAYIHPPTQQTFSQMFKFSCLFIGFLLKLKCSCPAFLNLSLIPITNFLNNQIFLFHYKIDPHLNFTNYQLRFWKLGHFVSFYLFFTYTYMCMYLYLYLYLFFFPHNLKNLKKCITVKL